MANSVNKVILVGNLGRDPEVKYTQGGQAVARFSMATNEVFTDREGQRQERTEWHRIVVWGKLAEICAQYLSKGRKVYVEGQLRTDEWTDRDGNKRQTTEVNVRDMVMLDGRGGDDRSERQDRGGGQSDPEPPIADDDIPF